MIMHRRTFLAGSVAFCAGTAVVPVYAHPSYALFDLEKVAIFEGTVVKFDYLNPHCWLFITVVDDAGVETLRGFEMDGPPGLMRQGIRPNYFSPGEQVAVKSNPLRDGRPAGLFRGVLKADGEGFGDVEGLVPPLPPG
ncbi:DUF6152 family protein [Devosia ginsengisoli]|uniref:Tat pathway signal protein n=1 Tax=Devosia ginsengisoli TaxID=400770 RepID=A0A5B8LPD4_9HYPH|nr:DUF6152 family protein [Devosia ginsengisoli]QDZ09789.1 hypothetical protein FPZ08_02925 [Devosia ginsengisoli]